MKDPITEFIEDKVAEMTCKSLTNFPSITMIIDEESLTEMIEENFTDNVNPISELRESRKWCEKKRNRKDKEKN